MLQDNCQQRHDCDPHRTTLFSPVTKGFGSNEYTELAVDHWNPCEYTYFSSDIFYVSLRHAQREEEAPNNFILQITGRRGEKGRGRVESMSTVLTLSLSFG